ncbi:MAG TPA: hypothetical protein VFC39_01870 [Acidobacteriaceae bacterium]|nr:hypothetical protein [Acidobacteriaceae bacterium]
MGKLSGRTLAWVWTIAAAAALLSVLPMMPACLHQTPCRALLRLGVSGPAGYLLVSMTSSPYPLNVALAATCNWLVFSLLGIGVLKLWSGRRQRAGQPYEEMAHEGSGVESSVRNSQRRQKSAAVRASQWAVSAAAGVLITYVGRASIYGMLAPGHERKLWLALLNLPGVVVGSLVGGILTFPLRLFTPGRLLLVHLATVDVFWMSDVCNFLLYALIVSCLIGWWLRRAR